MIGRSISSSSCSAISSSRWYEFLHQFPFIPFSKEHVHNVGGEKTRISVLHRVFLQIVPEKFAKNFRGQISGVVKLEAPDGNLYKVNVSQDLNKLVFRYGWGAFCSAYELEQGDMLVFRYRGDSHFKVLIFDPSGCEKEFFRVVMNPSCGVRQRGIPHEQSPSGEGFARHRTGELSHSRKASKMTPADTPSQSSSTIQFETFHLHLYFFFIYFSKSSDLMIGIA